MQQKHTMISYPNFLIDKAKLLTQLEAKKHCIVVFLASRLSTYGKSANFTINLQATKIKNNSLFSRVLKVKSVRDRSI